MTIMDTDTEFDKIVAQIAPVVKSQKHKFLTDPRPLIAFDWSASKLDCVDDLGNEFIVKTFEELVARVAGTPHRFVCEASFESFVPGRREKMLAAARAAGHEIYTFNPKATARHRRRDEDALALATGKPRVDTKIGKAGDILDSRIIRNIAVNTTQHVAPMIIREPVWAERNATLNREYFILKMTKQKPEVLIKPAKKILGWYSKLSDADKVLLGNGKAYSDSMLATAYYATKNTKSRSEYERLLGLWQAGFPSLLRSDVHHHGFGSMSKRGTTIKQYRQGMRRLRQIFVAAGVGPA